METIGENMQLVVDCVDEMTGGDADAAIKLLALVTGEYMLNQGMDNCAVTAAGVKIVVDISDGED